MYLIREVMHCKPGRVGESEAESLDGFREMEEAVMADEAAQKAMAGYHELVEDGRREIYRVE